MVLPAFNDCAEPGEQHMIWNLQPFSPHSPLSAFVHQRLARIKDNGFHHSPVSLPFGSVFCTAGHMMRPAPHPWATVLPNLGPLIDLGAGKVAFLRRSWPTDDSIRGQRMVQVTRAQPLNSPLHSKYSTASSDQEG